MNNRSNLSIAGVAFLAVGSLIASVGQAAAEPPSCDAMKGVYPVLGANCATSYSKINHSPTTPQQRADTYRARSEVLKYFKQAVLCQGMNVGTKQDFASGQRGHLEVLQNLYTSMQNNNDNPLPAVFNVTSVTINKQQCK